MAGPLSCGRWRRAFSLKFRLGGVGNTQRKSDRDDALEKGDGNLARQRIGDSRLMAVFRHRVEDQAQRSLAFAHCPRGPAVLTGRKRRAER